jgi:hypothetical protein
LARNKFPNSVPERMLLLGQSNLWELGDGSVRGGC